VVLCFPNKKEAANKDRLCGHPQINIAIYPLAVPKSVANFSGLEFQKCSIPLLPNRPLQ
jgi:hypothetical protein